MKKKKPVEPSPPAPEPAPFRYADDLTMDEILRDTSGTVRKPRARKRETAKSLGVYEAEVLYLIEALVAAGVGLFCPVASSSNLTMISPGTASSELVDPS